MCSRAGAAAQSMRVAVPVVKSGEKYLLVPHFGRAPSLAIAEVEGGSYAVVEVFENPHVAHEHGRGAALIGELARRGVSAVLTLGIGHGAFYRLRELGVRVYYVAPPPGRKTVTLEEALDMLLSGRAEEAAEPREAEEH